MAKGLPLYNHLPTYQSPSIGSSPTGAISPISGAPAVGSAYGQGGSVYGSQVPTGTAPASMPASPQPDYSAYAPGGSVYNSQVPAAARGAAPPPSPQDILNGIMGGSNEYVPTVDNTDYLAQANQIYDPQMDYLAGLEASAQKNAAKSGKSLDQMYAELARQIAGQAGGIKQEYGIALGDVGRYGAESLAAVLNSFDATRNGVADTLARLGIQEAAPNTVGQNTEMQQLMQSILTANSQATKNQLIEGRQGALDLNTANVSGARMQGGEARERLAGQLQGFLQELGLKKADIQSQIQNWAMTAKSDADKTAYERWKDSQGFDLQRADLAQKAGQYGTDLQYKYDALEAEKAKNVPKLDPVGAAKALATKIYGGNNTAADNALNAVTTTIAQWQSQHSGEEMTVGAIWDQLQKRFNGKANDMPQLRQLTAELLNQMKG